MKISKGKLAILLGVVVVIPCVVPLRRVFWFYYAWMWLIMVIGFWLGLWCLLGCLGLCTNKNKAEKEKEPGTDSKK